MNRLIETIEMKQGKREYLSFDSIIEFIKEMSYSQGFYGRLYRDIMELKENDIDAYEEFKEQLEGQKFKDTLDIVYYFEC